MATPFKTPRGVVQPGGRLEVLLLGDAKNCCDCGEQITDLEATAYHEAGHVVVASYCGHAVGPVSIRADADEGNLPSFSAPVHPTDDNN